MTVNPSELWRLGHPWALVYTFGVDHPPVARALGRLVFGSDLRLLYDAIEATAALPAGSAVLDVPCGSGVGLRGVRPGQGLRYVAADIAPAMIGRTQRAADRLGVGDQVQTRRCDVQSLPFADGEFDACVSFSGLHCFPDPGRAIAELGRVLGSGGELRLSWFATDRGRRYLPLIAAGRLAGVMGPSASTGEVRAWLAEAGLGDIELTTSGALAYLTATRR